LNDWRDALRDYWQWKEEAHVDESRLRQFAKQMAGRHAFGRQEVERIQRIHAHWAETKLEPLKVTCRVKLVQVNEGSGEVEALLSVMERHVHRDRQHRLRLEEENRWHRMKLKMGRGRWHVVEDVPLTAPPTEGESGVAKPFSADHRRTVSVGRTPAGFPGQDSRRSFWRDAGRDYRRDWAVRYAESWWNGHHPNFRAFAADCTNFVSQCLLAGGAPMTHVGRTDQGWWYLGNGGPDDRWSLSWAVAHSFRWYLSTSQTGLRAVEKRSASQLEPGDVICYDFDGDGRWQHNAIVVDFDHQGEPLVNAHSASVRHKHWTYRHSYAWTEQIQYKFFHIVDHF